MEAGPNPEGSLLKSSLHRDSQLHQQDLRNEHLVQFRIVKGSTLGAERRRQLIVQRQSRSPKLHASALLQSGSVSASLLYMPALQCLARSS